MKKIVGMAVVSASVFMLAGCNTNKEQKREATITQTSSEEKKKLEIICFKTFETDELGKAIITGTTEPDAIISIENQKETADEHGLFRIEYQLSEPITKELRVTAKIKNEETEKKIQIEPSVSYQRSKESSSAVAVAETQPSTETTQAQTTPSTTAEQPKKDDQVGQVLVTPNGEAVTVLRVLPNGERVVSEETSQADLNNDGILTYEELAQAENDLNKQTEEIRRRQLEEQEQ